MPVRRIREDSVSGNSKKPTREQLQRENERLKEQVKILEDQVEDTQLALCDVYEAMLGEVSSDGAGLSEPDPQGQEDPG